MARRHVDDGLVGFSTRASFAAEQYQGLRLQVERLRQARSAQVIAISSPGVGDGKTVTSINLAAALAHGSKVRVLLIDADLRRPAVSHHLGLPETDAVGLAQAALDDTITLEQATRRVDAFGFDVIPAGSSSVPVQEILRSSGLERLLQEARRRYAHVVLDTPPLVPVYDSALLARSVDGVILVIAADKTPRRLLEESLNLLDPAQVLGIVFNGDRRPLFRHYDTYYRS